MSIQKGVANIALGNVFGSDLARALGIDPIKTMVSGIDIHCHVKDKVTAVVYVNVLKDQFEEVKGIIAKNKDCIEVIQFPVEAINTIAPNFEVGSAVRIADKKFRVKDRRCFENRWFYDLENIDGRILCNVKESELSLVEV